MLLFCEPQIVAIVEVLYVNVTRKLNVFTILTMQYMTVCSALMGSCWITLTLFAMALLIKSCQLRAAANVLTRVVLNTQQSHYCCPLQQLQWLPIRHRICLQIASITFTTFYSSQPT